MGKLISDLVKVGSFAVTGRKADFSAERDIISDPILDVNKKIIEIRNGYKSIPHYFRAIQVDGVD